jgi:FkbM family methyltransferase
MSDAPRSASREAPVSNVARSDNLPVLVRAAFFWNKYGIRGRGFLPRLIGRKLIKRAEYFIVTKNGAGLLLDLDNLDIYATIFNQGGEWEPHVARACQRLLRNNDVFFDIGANVGCISLDTKALKGDGIKICLFEPQPSLSGAIKKSVAINRFKEVYVFDCLLSDYDGAGELYLTSHAIHASMVPRERSAAKISRPVWKVDTLVSGGQCAPPDIVKIDTEGAELKILDGMRKTLEEYSPSILFEADQNMNRFGYGADDLISLISSASDYKFYIVLDDGKLQNYVRQGRSDNILAIASRHQSRISKDWVVA